MMALGEDSVDDGLLGGPGVGDADQYLNEDETAESAWRALEPQRVIATEEGLVLAGRNVVRLGFEEVTGVTVDVNRSRLGRGLAGAAVVLGAAALVARALEVSPFGTGLGGVDLSALGGPLVAGLAALAIVLLVAGLLIGRRNRTTATVTLLLTSGQVRTVTFADPDAADSLASYVQRASPHLG
jgi:hypothetical protein